MSKEQPSPAGPLVLKVGSVANGKYYAAGEPIPFDAETIPDSLRPYLADDAEPEPPAPPTLNFQPNRVYEVDPQGAILTRAGRRQGAQLAGEDFAQQQAEEEVIAVGALDAETAAILQEKHDVDVALQIKTAEIRARDADAVVTAAQDEGAGGAEQKPPAIYVKRGGAWMHAERARLRPGEPVFVKRPTGEWEAVGAVDASGGLPPPEVIL